MQEVRSEVTPPRVEQPGRDVQPKWQAQREGLPEKSAARGAFERRDEGKNVHRMERLASVALGTVLVARGLRHRSLGRMLGAAAGAALLERGLTGHCRAYSKLGIDTAHRGLSAEESGEAIETAHSITVARPKEELYALFKDPESFRRIMEFFAEVQSDGSARVWTAKGKLGDKLRWRTELTEDVANERMAWRSLPGELIGTEGLFSLREAPADLGTVVTLRQRFRAPLGKLGAKLGKTLGFAPKLVTLKALRRLKSLAEAGEFPTTEHNPTARAARSRR